VHGKPMFLEHGLPQIVCGQHGQITTAVPWARHDDRFSRPFEEFAAWQAAHMWSARAAAGLRISWQGLAGIVARVAAEVSVGTDQLEGLRRVVDAMKRGTLDAVVRSRRDDRVTPGKVPGISGVAKTQGLRRWFRGRCRGLPHDVRLWFVPPAWAHPRRGGSSDDAAPGGDVDRGRVGRCDGRVPRRAHEPGRVGIRGCGWSVNMARQPLDVGLDLRESAVNEWLMQGDPSVRWQVMRDLLGAPPEQAAAVRDRIALEGWGAQLLAAQDADGCWAGGLYSPKWTSTTYTLLLLERLGLVWRDPRALAGCRRLWDSARWYGGGLTLAKSIREPETCITGMLVLLAAAFGDDEPRVDSVVDWLVGQQLADGGWNCESIRCGSMHGSFHTSITVLEALFSYGRSGGSVPVSAAMAAGRQFFLDHRLYRSHRTGEVADRTFTRFPFPPQWHYDIVRGLEHFRAVRADRDERLRDAIDEVRRARRPDGTWPTYRPYPGRQWFPLEARGPSRWSTLRAMRVLAWWDGRGGDDTE
jgi:hypothetical protein